MKEEQYEPSRVNKQAPQPGMAAVDTDNSDEKEKGEEVRTEQSATQRREGALQNGAKDNGGATTPGR